MLYTYSKKKTMSFTQYNTGYVSPIECCNCGFNVAGNSDACLFTLDGIIYFYCGSCEKKCKVKGCNSCFPNQTHSCKWCKKDVKHQDKDCPLIHRITLCNSEQLETHLKAQEQSENTRHALILQENALILQENALLLQEKDKLILAIKIKNEADELKNRLTELEEIVKKQQLQILILIDALAQRPKLIRQEVRKQLDSQTNSSTALIIYKPNK
jgi:hypothetical protein